MAKPGRPGEHGGRRFRHRNMIRNLRATDPAAIQRIADAEIAYKRRVVRVHIVGLLLWRAAWLAIAAALCFIAWRVRGCT